MYCSTMRYNCTVTAMKKFRLSYNNSLQRLLNIPKHNRSSEMFVNLNIKSFGELMKNQIYSFINKIAWSKN